MKRRELIHGIGICALTGSTLAVGFEAVANGAPGYAAKANPELSAKEANDQERDNTSRVASAAAVCGGVAYFLLSRRP